MKVPNGGCIDRYNILLLDLDTFCQQSRTKNRQPNNHNPSYSFHLLGFQSLDTVIRYDIFFLEVDTALEYFHMLGRQNQVDIRKFRLSFLIEPGGQVHLQFHVS
jgi:hypothetical protein